MIEAVVALLFGLTFGSFLNVCIYRLPRDLSVSYPGSRCPVCLHPIRWYHNVPVLGWIALGGRCHDCRASISWRYPAIELITGLLFAAATLTYGPNLASVKWCAFLFLLLGMIFTDIDLRILPDEFTLGGTALGVASAAFIPFEGGLFELLWPDVPAPALSVFQSLFAAAFVSGGMWLIAFLYSKVRGREGLGFGDVKMVAMMGAFLGLSKAMTAIFLGCISGAIGGLAYIYLRKKDPATYELPFGSFLGASAILVTFLN